MNGLNRCKMLALQSTDEEILQQISKIKPSPLEELNLINLRETPEITSHTIQLFKNIKPSSLKVVRIFNIDFKVLIEHGIICPSVHLLEISSYYMKDRVTKTEQVLQVFPNLRRLEFMQSAKTDLHTYLATHVETPLEHVTFDVTRNDSRSDGKFRAQVKSIDFAHFIPARLGNVLEDMAQLTHLTHRFVTPALVAPKASNLVSLNINTNSEIAREIFAHAKNLRHLAINREVLGDVILPDTLKSVIINADKDAFNPKSLLKLLNLEVLKIYGDATPFWKCDFSHMTQLREVHFEGDFITQWNNSMDKLGNLTYVVISAELKKIPGSFFKGCTKITYLNLDFNHLKKISDKICLLKNLENFSARANMMKKVPYGLARLEHLNRIDLRDNPISSVPVTLPLRTVIFTDLEWIRTLQSTLLNANNAPSVHHMLRLPYIRPHHKMACLSEFVNRRVLHGLGVPDMELEDHEKNVPFGDINEGTNRMLYAQSKLEAVGLLLFVENFKRTSMRGRSHSEQRFIRATMDEKNKIRIYSLVVDQKKTESNLVGVLSEIEQFELTEIRRKVC